MPQGDRRLIPKASARGGVRLRFRLPFRTTIGELSTRGETCMSGRLGVLLLMFACLTGPAGAAPPLVARGEATPLAAWAVFCSNYPAECTVDASEPETVARTPEFIDLIDAVN